LAIYFFNKTENFKEFKNFKRKKTKSWLKKIIIENGKKVGDISIIFCSDQSLFEINQTYLKHFYFTDVITFNYNYKSIINGDLYISIDRVYDNSAIFQNNFELELNRVIVHGVLHLLNFKDKSKNQKMNMRILENHYLNLIDMF